MHVQTLGSSTVSTTRIAYGCMQIGGSWDRSPYDAKARAKALAAVRAAVDAGITCFDHADIYCIGKSEEVFADVAAELKLVRSKIVLQSKCGIRFGGDPQPDAPGRYDFSRGHIVESTEKILRRLKTDYLDVLLLHRPDALVEPDEVAEAFDGLHASGKVRWFGVSNHNAGQIELLRGSLRQPLIVNQVQLSLIHHHLINAGIVHNQGSGSLGAEGVLDYCRLNRITLQAWGPLAGGKAIGAADGSDALGKAVAALAKKRGVSAEAIAIAWLLRHPAKIQPVIGSTDPARIASVCQADAVELSREEWYALFTAARGGGVP